MPAWLRALPNVGGDVPNSMLAGSIVHLIGLCFSAGTGTFLRYNRLKIIIFATQLNDAVGAPAMVGWFQKDPDCLPEGSTPDFAISQWIMQPLRRTIRSGSDQPRDHGMFYMDPVTLKRKPCYTAEQSA